MYTVVWYIPFHPVYIYIYHVSYRKFAPKPTSKGLYEACWTVLMFSKKSYWYNSRREMVPQSAFLRWTSWWYSKDSARMLLSSSSLTNSWVFHAIAKQKFRISSMNLIIWQPHVGTKKPDMDLHKNYCPMNWNGAHHSLLQPSCREDQYSHLRSQPLHRPSFSCMEGA